MNRVEIKKNLNELLKTLLLIKLMSCNSKLYLDEENLYEINIPKTIEIDINNKYDTSLLVGWMLLTLEPREIKLFLKIKYAILGKIVYKPITEAIKKPKSKILYEFRFPAILETLVIRKINKTIKIIIIVISNYY